MFRRVGVVLLLLIVVLVLFAVTELARTYGKARDFSDKIYVPLAREQLIHTAVPAAVEHTGAIVETASGGVPQLAAEIDDRKPFTLLLIGVDRRKGDVGRADALLVATVNPLTRTTVVASIPRDLRTTISADGREWQDKINHAYAYDGVEGTITAVENLLGIVVDYYVKADMEGFTEAVDVLGGVQVNNELSFAYEGHQFAKGELALSGEQALAYVRMRYEDPKGDIGRGDRQRAVLRSMVDQMLKIDGTRKLTDIFEQLSDDVATNVTFEQWKTLVLHYREAADHISVERIVGSGAMISGIYYYFAPEEELSRVSYSLNSNLLD